MYHQKNPQQNENYPPQPQGQSNNQETITTNQRPFSYASAVRRNPSNTNVRQDRNRNPSRKNSYTNMNQNQRNQSCERPNDNVTSILKQRITQLEDQINQQPQRNSNINNNTQQRNHHHVNQKNPLSAQSTEDQGGEPNIPKMLEFIANTMQTLKDFSTQLSQQQNTTQTHTGM